MCRKPDRQLSLEEFHFGKLNENNRWVRMAYLILWADIEEKYTRQFAKNNGQPANPLCMALGSIITKEKSGLSDEEAVEHIKERPYLQYVCHEDSSTKMPQKKGEYSL